MAVAVNCERTGLKAAASSIATQRSAGASTSSAAEAAAASFVDNSAGKRAPAFGGGDDKEHELVFNTTSTPAFASGSWVTFDIPLTQFTGLTTRANLAQLILSGTIATLFIDNIFFSADGPSVAAPTPTYAAGDVISLFSNAYTNRTVDTWSASWDQADVSDVQIGGNDVKKYTNLVFSGIEFTSATVNATAMTHFSFAVWTPDPVVTASEFKVKLVDFGAFVNFFGKRDGLVHVSQIANKRLNHPNELLKEGQEVKVKLLGFDDRGKVRLGMKMVDQETGAEIVEVKGEGAEA